MKVHNQVGILIVRAVGHESWKFLIPAAGKLNIDSDDLLAIYILLDGA